jgi:MFS family permease
MAPERLRALPGAVYRRNVALLVAVEVLWGVAMAFAPIGTVVPFLLRDLGASDVVIGSLSTINLVTMALPGLAAIYRSEHLRRKTPFFIVIHFPASIAFLGLAASAHWADRLGAGVAIALILACVACLGLSMGVAVPMWVNLIRKWLPARGRFRLWSWIIAVGTGAGLLGAWGSHQILGEAPSQDGYALCAVLTAVLTFVAVNLFWFVVEPEDAQPENHETFAHFLTDHFRRAWSVRPFRKLIAVRVFAATGVAMTGGFLAVAAKERFLLEDREAAVFSAIAVASMVSYGLWAGPAGDRLGRKPLCVVSPCLACLAAALALWGGSVWAFGAAFFLTGGLWVLDTVGVNGLVMDYCPDEDKSAFLAIAPTCVAPIAALGPVGGGLLARSAGYGAVFAVALILCAAGAIASAVALDVPGSVRRAQPRPSEDREAA